MKTKQIKFKTLFVLFAALALFSCEKEKNVEPSDETNANELIGTWRRNYLSGYEILEIKNNSTFIKTSYWIYPNNVEQKIMVLEGTYSVEDGKFVTDNVEMTFFEDIEGNSTLEQYEYLFPNSNIYLTNNVLKLHPVEEFEPMGNNTAGSIYGKWKSESTILVVYGTFLDKKFNTGSYTNIIELPVNTNDYYSTGILNYGGKNEKISDFQQTYQFDNNIFSINEFTFKAKVSFAGDKMIWERDPIGSYIKQ